MIAEFVNDDGTVDRVWIKITKKERWELIRAEIFSWFIFWKCPADFMSEELEALVCGWAPHRYVKIERVE